MSATSPPEFDLSAFEPARQPWPAPARAAVGVGVGCAGLVMLQLLLLWAVIAFMFSARIPRGVVSTVESPTAATVGKKAHLTLVVRNGSDEAVTLNSVSVMPAAHQNLRVENPEPPAQRVTEMGMRMWTYQRSIGPGETLKVRFDAVPEGPGKAKGTLRLQINLATREVPFEVEIRPEE